MHKSELQRPGAVQMLIAAVLMGIVGIGPIVATLIRPEHEWSLFLSGAPALVALACSIGFVLLYFLGFIRYTVSKGYSSWLGLFLFMGHIFGLIVLLMLPDRGEAAPGSGQPHDQSKPHAIHS